MRDFNLESGVKALKIIQGRVPEVSTKVVADHGGRMTTLYIVGNGFDLWHGLPTSYGEFNAFAEEALSEFESYYSSDFSVQGPWCDFENTLGKFDWKAFYDDHNHIDVSSGSFRPSFIYCLEDDLAEQTNQHVERIRECFQEWVSEIDVSLAERKLVFAENAKFLTFNYTSTLEIVYAVPDGQVLHIHGKADTYEELIFGHAETIEEEPEFDEYGESTRTPFSDAEGAARYPFYALQKPVEAILKNHKAFFDALEHVDKIIVVVLSLNKVALPYFKQVAEKAPTASWTVCSFKSEEGVNHAQALLQCGVTPAQIRLCGYPELEGGLSRRRT